MPAVRGRKSWLRPRAHSCARDRSVREGGETGDDFPPPPRYVRRMRSSTGRLIVVSALLCVCLCSAPAQNTGPRLGEAAFFASLDLARPDLAAGSRER